MPSSEEVFIGFWTNWTRGKIAGATLTLESRDGAYLVAFLAMFVRVTGNHFWRLLCFLAFRTIPRSAGTTDIPWGQQRAILRNSYSAMDAVVKFCRIAVRSRRSDRPSFFGPVFLAVTGLLNVVAFIVAGIFSSAVTRAQSAVLLNPSTCGSWLYPTLTTAAQWDEAAMTRSIDLVSLIHQNLITSSQYHSSCGGPLSQAGECNPYGGRSIKYTSSRTKCPFDSKICLGAEGVSFDTGYIDSHVDLGINAPHSDRVTLRKTTQCAPLRISDYSVPGVSANSTHVVGMGVNSNLTGFFYGPNRRVKSNYTYAYNPDAFQVSSGTGVEVLSYQLDIEAAAFGSSIAEDALASSSTFIPIPELRKANSSIILAFLANQATYLSPVVDPWFYATDPTIVIVRNSELHQSPIQMFASTSPVSLLGCLDQTEICNPNSGENSKCVFLPTECDIQKVTAGLAFHDRQQTTVNRLFDSISRTAIQQTAYSLGGGGMLASSYIQGSMSPGIPADQWAVEVENWFATGLTALQLFTVQYVTGYDRSDFNKYVTPPPPSDEWMCKNQIVQRNDFASFSILGLLAIILGCGFIIVLSEILSLIVPRIPGNSPSKKLNDLEWHAYDILELKCVAEDEPAAFLRKSNSISLYASALSLSPISRIPRKWSWLRWTSRPKPSRLDSATTQNRSPISTTDLLPREKWDPYNLIHTDTGSPISPRSVQMGDKI